MNLTILSFFFFWGIYSKDFYKIILYHHSLKTGFSTIYTHKLKKKNENYKIFFMMQFIWRSWQLYGSTNSSDWDFNFIFLLYSFSVYIMHITTPDKFMVQTRFWSLIRNKKIHLYHCTHIYKEPRRICDRNKNIKKKINIEKMATKSQTLFYISFIQQSPLLSQGERELIILYRDPLDNISFFKNPQYCANHPGVHKFKSERRLGAFISRQTPSCF